MALRDVKRMPLTDKEVASIRKKYDSGKILILRRGPSLCLCGKEMKMQYVGHKQDDHELEWSCECGEIFYG